MNFGAEAEAYKMAHFNHAPSHEEESKPCLRRIAVVGNYVPRQCGIATFTTDLCRATASVHPQATCVAVPINDTPEG